MLASALEAPASKPIEEVHPSTLNFKPAEPVDRRLIMDIPPVNLTQLRLVSSEFRNLIESVGPLTENLAYHINGDANGFKPPRPSEDSVPPPIRTLVNSTFRWAHLKFSNLDLMGDFFEQPPLFSKFVGGPCLPSLKSLTLANVHCGMGRFIEVVAACPKLEEIRILNCPTLFKAGIGIIKWQKFMGGFHERLIHLKHLTIIDGRHNETVLTLPTLQGWTLNMRNLVSLDLRVGSKCTLPISYLSQVIQRNGNTLRHLSLAGKCGIDMDITKAMRHLKLRSLMLAGITFVSGHSIFPLLLHPLTDLKSLWLQKITIHDSIFLKLSQHLNLEQLILEDVTIEGAPGIVSLAKSKTLKDLRVLDTAIDGSGGMWVPFFKESPNFQLWSLHLRFNDAPALPQTANLTFLRELVVMGAGKNGDMESYDALETLTRKVMQLPNLERLEIIDSPLTGIHFPPPPEDLTVEPSAQYLSFHNLKNLRFLSMSWTEIGDEVLTEHLIHLPSLEVLWINRTKVTTEGVWKIVNRRSEDAQVLKSLRVFQACGCWQLKMAFEEIWAVGIALNVEFYCDVKMVGDADVAMESNEGDDDGDEDMPEKLSAQVPSYLS